MLPDVWTHGVRHAFVAIGDNAVRLRVGETLLQQGFQLINAVHPSSVVARSVRIGAGTMIGAHAVVNPATVIGSHVSVNTAASVDHDGRA